jgi:hypothetical protein
VLHVYFQAILHQFLYGLNSCSPDTLLKAGAAYPEMAVQEKAVDMFVELLRKDQVLLYDIQLFTGFANTECDMAA